MDMEQFYKRLLEIKKENTACRWHDMCESEIPCKRCRHDNIEKNRLSRDKAIALERLYWEEHPDYFNDEDC